jgi:hypothetical protein
VDEEKRGGDLRMVIFHLPSSIFHPRSTIHDPRLEEEFGIADLGRMGETRGWQ